MLLEESVTKLCGVGEQRARLLAKLKIYTIEDMLYFFPREVENRGEYTPVINLENGETACILAQAVTNIQERRVRANLTIYSLGVSDNSGRAVMVWFNNKYIKNAIKQGDIFKFYGKVSIKNGRREMMSPVFEPRTSSLHTGRIVPIYPLTENLSQKVLRSIMKECVDKTAGAINEYLPLDVREKYNLCEINYAIANIHFPASENDYEIARKRLVFEELMMFQAGILYSRASREKGKSLKLDTSCFEEFGKLLKFKLTNAQTRVIHEIYGDMNKEEPMNRLVQGDVGSGKTIVAFAAMYAAFKNGLQSALMAPTEVLAVQHYKSAAEFFGEENISLLTGSVTGKKREIELERIKSGSAKIIIGTHAIIENKVEFDNLALTIADEQHRFGVRQRSMLAKKGISPHSLIMSATPIPRTLSLIIYGDLDISAVDEMPPGRQKIDTFAVNEAMRERINRFIVKNINEGRQVYIVCPLVAESEKSDLKAAQNLAERLAEGVLKNYNVELLHGRMKPKEKNEIMQRFAAGETNVLVSTTVIEVGVNVPNATVMIIENAERFGLAQLHQIRGRVGRGSEKSYCILMSSEEEINQRLKIMTQTNDGFEISKRDLQLRGPGDFLGTRQHGLPDLKIADLFRDMKMVAAAKEAALELMGADTALNKPNHILFKKKLNSMFAGIADGNIIG